MRNELGESLPRYARAVIEAHLSGAQCAPPSEIEACGDVATFVTLRWPEGLHGCIGSIRAHRPLAQDVRSNALAAAFRDPRGRRFHADEVPALSVEVSVLSPLRPLSFDGEADLKSKLIVGVDGLVIESLGRRATFLPQVWESLPEPTEFLRHLKHKAGMAPDDSAPELHAWTFSVEKFIDPACGSAT